jgi:ABC-2 type transport system permease protein
MNTLTVSVPGSTTSVRGQHRTVPVRSDFTGVLRAELIKLLSLRSTWWTLGLTVVVMTLFALGQAMSLDLMAQDPETAPALDAIHGAEIIAGGYQIGMITIAVLGALLITGEYSTGMIRSTLAAVPTRLPVLGAKAIATSVATALVSAVSLGLTYFITAPLLAEHSLLPDLTDPQTWQVAAGTTYFLVAAALFSLGMGTLLRSTAGAVTASLTVLLLLPGILQIIRLDWLQAVIDYLPQPAATAFLTVSDVTLGGAQELAPVTGLLVVAAYAIVPMALAAVSLRRRDA